MSATPVGPFLNSHFRVEIAGMPYIDFTLVILPEASAEVIEVRNGGDPRNILKAPGIIKFSNLILQRGVTESKDLFAWWTNIANGVSDRRNVSVILLDAHLKPMKQWNFSKVWPSKYIVSPLIPGNDTVTETIECVTESFQLA